VEWSWLAWSVSVAAVIASGAVAWLEGNWIRRPGLTMGFANHGGMWGDLVLLPVANAAIVPHLTAGIWLPVALSLATLASVVVHVYWYRGDSAGTRGARAHAPEHMWPTRSQGTWHGDLSWAGWLHVLYVAAELTLLTGFLVHVTPPPAAVIVCAIFTIHVPLGLLQPRWYVSGRIASFREQPLLLPCLSALWLLAALKAGGFA
jgi:hypothetical protein